MKKPLGLIGWQALEEELSAIVGRPVDLVSAKGISALLKEEIEKELLVLYDEAN